MLQLFYVTYFVFACVKGPFCVHELPFLLTRYFYTPNAKYPFYIRKIQVNACPYPPSLYTQTQTRNPGPMHAMRASKHGGNCLDVFFAVFQSFRHTCPSGIPPPHQQSMHNKNVW